MEILESVPGTADLADMRVEDFRLLMSSQLTVDDVFAIAERIRQVLSADDDLTGVIVTHGTGTLEETAFATALMNRDPRPVVFTGAMLPDPPPLSDGPSNLLNAVRVATAKESINRGVLVSVGAEIHSAVDAHKYHTSARSAFTSGEFGPLGRIYPDGVRFLRHRGLPPHFPTPNLTSNIDLIRFAVGADGRHIDASVEAGARGIVIEASGQGNLNAAFLTSIGRAIDAGVPVVICSRCEMGRTVPVYGTDSGGVGLLDRGCLFSSLSGIKARLFLMLALSQNLDHGKLQTLLNRVP
jgi:L-asparaginase